MTALTIAISGINATDNPGPGTGVARSLREADDLDVRIIGLAYDAMEPGIYMDWLVEIAHYDVAISAAPFALEPKLGQLLPIMAQGRWGEAESLAYQIVSVDHYNYFGNLRLAIALRMQEKIDAAYQIVVKMAQAYPTDIYFLTELAILNDAQGNTKEATRLFTDILVLDPENRDARSYLGR